MRNSAPSQRNHTGEDCGWPVLSTVVSQMIVSCLSRASAAACRGLSRLSIVTSVLAHWMNYGSNTHSLNYHQRGVRDTSDLHQRLGERYRRLCGRAADG